MVRLLCQPATPERQAKYRLPKASVEIVDADALMGLFGEVVGGIREALGTVEDWGLTGIRATQYHHDVAADQVALDQLLGAGLGVLSEETGLQHGDRDVVVVVDPIDGSTNASIGLPWFATSLCAVRNGVPEVALVVNLASGETFDAIAGRGARRNGEPLVAGTVVPLSDAVVAISGLPPEHPGWAQFRCYGAAALDIASVASGVFDGFVDWSVDAHGVWDYLGAMLICHEAGAPCVDAHGRDLVVLDHEARRTPVAATDDLLLTALLDRRQTH